MMQLAHILVFLVCGSAAWVALCVVIPWLTRRMALYGLHTARDQVYETAEKFPAALESLLYRDVEFILSYAIHVVRERDWPEALALASKLHGSSKKARPSWRRKRYNAEISSLYMRRGGKRALRAILTAPENVRSFLMIRVVGSNPFLLIASFLIAFWTVLMSWTKAKIARRPSARRVSAELPPEAFRVGTDRPPHATRAGFREVLRAPEFPLTASHAMREHSLPPPASMAV
jgi:hypothetical protein